MSLYYFDASAVVKYYVLEPGRSWVREVVNARAVDGKSRVNTLFVSEASIAEAAAAFAVLHRTQRISQRARDGAFRAFLKDIADGVLNAVPLLTVDFHTAAHLAQQT